MQSGYRKNMAYTADAENVAYIVGQRVFVSGQHTVCNVAVAVSQLPDQSAMQFGTKLVAQSLFAEFELSFSTGNTQFAYETSGQIKRTYSDNTQLKLGFNPGAAVYIFPNVCATLSFGLGGIQYTSVTQKDADGNKIGTRQSSNMKFKLNIFSINFGMTIHLWDKKKL